MTIDQTIAALDLVTRCLKAWRRRRSVYATNEHHVRFLLHEISLADGSLAVELWSDSGLGAPVWISMPAFLRRFAVAIED